MWSFLYSMNICSERLNYIWNTHYWVDYSKIHFVQSKCNILHLATEIFDNNSFSKISQYAIISHFSNFAYYLHTYITQTFRFT